MPFPIAAVIAAAATVASSAISAKAASDRQKKEFERQKELQDKQYQLSQLDPVTEYYKQAYPGMKKDQAFVNPADMSGPNNTAALGNMVGSIGSVAGSLGGSFGSGGGNQTFGSETANTSIGDTQANFGNYLQSQQGQEFVYKKGGKVQKYQDGGGVNGGGSYTKEKAIERFRRQFDPATVDASYYPEYDPETGEKLPYEVMAMLDSVRHKAGVPAGQHAKPRLRPIASLAPSVPGIHSENYNFPNYQIPKQEVDRVKRSEDYKKEVVEDKYGYRKYKVTSPKNQGGKTYSTTLYGVNSPTSSISVDENYYNLDEIEQLLLTDEVLKANKDAHEKFRNHLRSLDLNKNLYYKGGKVQIEAEGQELIEGDVRRMANENPGRIIPVSSRIGLITGPSHAGGGVSLNADNGSYIIPKKDANRYMEMSAKEKEGYKRALPEGGSKKYQAGGPVFPGVPSYLDPNPYKFNPDDWYDPSHEQAPEGLYQGSNLNPVHPKMVPSTQYEPSASDYTVPTNRDIRVSQRIPGQFQENVAARLGQAGSMAPLVSTLGQGVGLAGNIAAMAYKPKMPKYTPYQQSASYAGALRDVLNQKDMDPDIVANLKNAIARRALAMRQEGKYLTTASGLAYNQAAANQLTQAENEFAMNRANYRNALRQQRVGAGQAMDTARATETADRNTIAAMNQQFKDQNAQRQVSNLQTIGASVSNIGLSFEDRLRARKEWEAGQDMRDLYLKLGPEMETYRRMQQLSKAGE